MRNELSKSKRPDDALVRNQDMNCFPGRDSRRQVPQFNSKESPMTEIEIELLKDLGYLPIQIFNLTDAEVKEILVYAALNTAQRKAR